MSKAYHKAQRDEAVAMIALLAEAFPACFAVYEMRRRPLKLGIHWDILTAVSVAPDELRRALGHYTRAAAYCAGLKPGAARIDLAGREVGVVTEDEAKAAKENLARHKARLAKRREARAQRAAAAPPAQTDVRRSVEKLRAAARQRALAPEHANQRSQP